MNIAYSCDEAYIHHTGISILSLLENNTNATEINIYFIEKNVSEKSVNLLRNIIEGYKRKLIVIPFEKLCSRLNAVQVGRHVETVYAKLFFGNIENVDKIFYLDSDTIVNGSLLPLWNINIENYYFGCVKTITKDSCKKLGLQECDDFFNDGVALVNTKALRKDGLENKFLDFIAAFDGNPPFLSEGTINVVCKGKILPLDPKYNLLTGFLMFNNEDLGKLARQPTDFYTDEELDRAKSTPIVIHYLTGWFKRPWEIGCSHPLREFYKKFKDQSPWKMMPLVKKNLPLKIRFLKILFAYFPTKWVLTVRKFWRK